MAPYYTASHPALLSTRKTRLSNHTVFSIPCSIMHPSPISTTYTYISS